MSLNILYHPGPVIDALHLPDFTFHRHLPVARAKECAPANAWVVAEVGIPWINLQEQAKTAGPVAPHTSTLMAALGWLIPAEPPQLFLGIIMEAHDPDSAPPVVHATGANFARLKVLVGGAMTAQGPRNCLAAKANVADAMTTADGAIVGDGPLRRDSDPEDLLWRDIDLCPRFMDAVRVAA